MFKTLEELQADGMVRPYTGKQSLTFKDYHTISVAIDRALDAPGLDDDYYWDTFVKIRTILLEMELDFLREMRQLPTEQKAA